MATSHTTRTLGLAVALACAAACAPLRTGTDTPTGSVRVTSEANAGEGSFRAAVEAANLDASVHTISFAPDLEVALLSDVTYSGQQALAIDGNGSALVGHPDAPHAPTWDGGLLRATGGADLDLRALHLAGSFNNGVGIFVPGDTSGVVRIELHDVHIRSSRFHGLLVDGQRSADYDSDDVPHPFCHDPWGVDSPASILLRVSDSSITTSGTLVGGFDIGTPTRVDGERALTGCPADFDGVRVDEGGPGDIDARLERSRINDNLADGVEYDERGPGGVTSSVVASQIERNGDTGSDDRDDGFDIDETGPGSIDAYFQDVRVLDNHDEGIDLDEAGPGSAVVAMHGVIAQRNADEDLKIDEEGDGDLLLSLGEPAPESFDMKLAEEGAGRLVVFEARPD